GERRPVSEPGTRVSAASSWELLANLWGGLARFWSAAPTGPDSLANVHENNGCSIDPNGGSCKPSSPAPAPLGNGCSIDPDGGGCWGS
ncbi:MAG TPA: hypothetical protein VOA87_04155, partial [Thermoanaerobaculia bacterium]|nr:hypothetical protein [Thermoanaerobaculia bacterium]